MNTLRPYQTKAIEDCKNLLRRGVRRVCVHGVTGSGKTTVFTAMARSCVDKGGRVLILTNRQIQWDQASGTLDRHDVDHGVIAANYDDERSKAVQVASIPTLYRRFQKPSYMRPEANLVLVDEAHMNKAKMAQDILNGYPDACIIGFTATPADIGHMYDELVSMGSKAEMREGGYIVGGKVFSPTEMDLQGLSTNSSGEYSLEQNERRIQECKIIGDVVEHWERLNPDVMGKRLPSVAWTPTVASSQWVREEFNHEGFPFEHIDGNTPRDERKEIFEALESGELVGVTSCGVLREAWDFPGVAHGILLNLCGSRKAYDQQVGRLMRPSEGKGHYVLQDHTGAVRRHGHPDLDHDWSLGDTSVSINQERKKKLREGKEKEGIVCPKCSYERQWGPKCPECGHQHKQSVRKVRQIGGDLVEVRGPTVKIRKEKQPGEKQWTSYIFKSVHCGWTLAQALNMYRDEFGRFPPEDHVLRAARTNKANYKRYMEGLYPWARR